MHIINEKKWYRAINNRKSRRRYLRKQVDKKLINYLNSFIEQLNNVFKSTRIVLVNDSDYIFKGIIGKIGKIKGAKTYAVFIADIDDENVKEKIGYTGEAFILEATSLGLGTCWVAGTYKPEIVKKYVDLKKSEKIAAVTPVGYSEENKSLEEIIMSKIISSHKRKKLDKICSGGFKEDWPQWIKTAIKCARLAPSALNKQPWRFEVEDDSITVSIDEIDPYRNIPKRLDCGIAMLHLEVGASHEGVRGEWEFMKPPFVASFKKI